MNAPRRDPGGPVVAVCTGSRCSALRRLGDSVTGIELLSPAVAATRGGVLVSCGCLGRCELAAMVLVCWRGAVAAEPIPLAGMEHPARATALAEWLTGHGPAASLLRGARLPGPLSQARLDAGDHG